MALFHSNSPLVLKIGFAFTAFTTVCLLYSTWRLRSLSSSFGDVSDTSGAIVHIVMFQYKPSVNVATKSDVASAFVALKDACMLPDGAKYIISIDGGLNNSPEGKTKGMEQAFVVTFRTAGERDYYLDTDPAHQAFKVSIADKVEDATVFDFARGEFVRRAAARRRRPSDEIHVRTV